MGGKGYITIKNTKIAYEWNHTLIAKSSRTDMDERLVKSNIEGVVLCILLI